MPPGLKVATLFAAVAVTVVTVFAPTHAEPIPLDIAYRDLSDDIGTLKEININIPVDKTTQPVYGGVVRYYDVALAQAAAITYKTCKSRDEKGAYLYLTAGSQGRIKMGTFYISCNLAYDLVSAYDLNESVTRPVKGMTGDNIGYMPSLNLDTDAKAQRFVNFSSNFKPVERN